MHYFSGKGCSEFLESMHYCIGILSNVWNPNYENNSQLKTQSQLALDMGLDVRTLQNYKLLQI